MNGRLKVNCLVCVGRVFACLPITAFLAAAASRSASAQQANTRRYPEWRRICGANRIDHSMQRARISFPIEIHCCALEFGIEIVRLDSERRGPKPIFFSETAQMPITERNLLQHEAVARIEINGALQAVHASSCLQACLSAKPWRFDVTLQL
jgi:hypothetical protein